MSHDLSYVRRWHGVNSSKGTKTATEQQMEMDHLQMIHLSHDTVLIIRFLLATVLRPEVFQRNSEKN